MLGNMLDVAVPLCRRDASSTSLEVNVTATIRPVSASTPRCSMRHDRRVAVPCFSSSHSPPPAFHVLGTRNLDRLRPCRTASGPCCHQQIQGLAVSPSTGGPRPRHVQRRRTPAQGRMIRHTQAEAEQADDGADQPLGLPEARRNTARSVSAVRMASGEYQACPPRVVRASAAHAATASSVNHTVKLPR